MTGGIGLLSVWTSLLLVVMNGIKFGKHGLLFITVYVTFLKFMAVYFMIWIGYILAFYMICKDILEQFKYLNFVPKLLVMFIGEYDVDGTFYPNNQLMPGSEAALILYSAYIFTMFIVMMNIMVRDRSPPFRRPLLRRISPRAVWLSRMSKSIDRMPNGNIFEPASASFSVFKRISVPSVK